ncbi:hypothetical protein HYH03_002876 [Edaphochlamys debaryana]|uniref:Uncharacterized protein n=1 Tax=Edaphochlamys debaryana TaxID=47281 RepID=A0A835YDK0_9CHLO|nr:hypothetical protein HYH03_002876 [Edaphochlamys debaryana]|eukprot:KAG2499298.1 hypothetical protein HYH03_002876 [Edaphochlamys debaryana]
MLGQDLSGIVSRDDPVTSTEEDQGPIYVATTNDALDAVLERTPPGRRGDLVLLQAGRVRPLLFSDGSQPSQHRPQNGWLLPWLEQRGVPEDVTLVALYMAAGSDGTARCGLRTVVSGRWAEHVSRTLARGGVSCRVVSRPALLVALVEKKLWAALFWMMSAALGGATVGDIVTHHRADVAALVDELLPLLRAQLLRMGTAANRGRDDAAACDAAADGPQGHGAGADCAAVGGVEAAASLASARGDAGLGRGSGSVAPAGEGLVQWGGTGAGSTPFHEAAAALQAHGAVVDALVGYSESIAAAVPSKEMALREFAWRNGALLRLARTPLHCAWLRRAGVPPEVLAEYGA